MAPLQGGLTVEQWLVLVTPGLMFSRAAPWGMMKAGRPWAWIWAP